MSSDAPSPPGPTWQASQMLEITLPSAVVLVLIALSLFRRQLKRAQYELAVAQLKNEATMACLWSDANEIKELADELSRLCAQIMRDANARPTLSDTRLPFQGSLYDADDEDDEETENSSSDTDDDETESSSSSVAEEEVFQVGEVRRGRGHLVVPDDVAEVVDADDCDAGDDTISEKHLESDRDSNTGYDNSALLSDSISID
ncbi:hypothetical protein B0T22DRAFT_441333 [Podospora appendiculata]|uniref:Uncharacterized protein n=1 Tax=Podospora appendiculata TaxID=314037 RepID=A0AAE0XC27_9PEZI|nr:hypothetical protein B0T22DRAFT_441333 [Podospora appendiculata]